MLLRTLRAETIKLRRNPVWLTFLLLPLISAFMGTFNYLNNVEILKNQWYDLWTQHTLFSCSFFLPALIGITCAVLCRLENFGHNWNSVLSAPVPVSSVFFAKLLEAVGMTVLTQLWVGVLFVVSGKLAGLQAPLPTKDLFSWLLFGAMGGAVICAVQLFLSLLIRSFAVPVGIALIGGIVGLLASAKGLGVYIPYALISVGMNANGSEALSVYGSGRFAVSCILFFAIFSFAGVLWLKKRDVAA